MLKLKKKVLKPTAQDIDTVVSEFIHQQIFQSASYLCGTEFGICFSQKQFIGKTFSFEFWRENINPRFKPGADFTVTPIQTSPLLAKLLSTYLEDDERPALPQMLHCFY